MKIVFVSNFYNHHQSALSEAFYKETSGNYYFIQTMPMSSERKDMGWSIALPDYVKESYANSDTYSECINLINDADVVIIGSAPNKLIKQRLKERKLVFRYSERIYKNRKNIITWPLRVIKYHTYNYGSKNVYLLCASAYAASDYAKSFNYIGKAYKWGYFPAVKKYDDIKEIINRKQQNSILWVARFIDWKHPETPIKLAKKLKDNGYSFQLNMIGTGVLTSKAEAMINSYNLKDCVHLLGAMSPERVREYMECSEIFVCTSDRNEGWGAVINEAMNSGCAVVANRAVGAAPYLINDNENGLTFKNGNIDELFNKVGKLLENSNLIKEIGVNAYLTITKLWNAETAAERFISGVQNLIEGEKEGFFYESGPCSLA